MSIGGLPKGSKEVPTLPRECRCSASAEALRQATLATMDDRTNPEWANPSTWAPFVLVGEGGVMTR